MLFLSQNRHSHWRIFVGRRAVEGQLGSLRARRRRGRRCGGRRAQRRRGGSLGGRERCRMASSWPARLRPCASQSRGPISTCRRPFREQLGSLRARWRRGRRQDRRGARRRRRGPGRARERVRTASTVSAVGQSAPPVRQPSVGGRAAARGGASPGHSKCRAHGKNGRSSRADEAATTCRAARRLVSCAH